MYLEVLPEGWELPPMRAKVSRLTLLLNQAPPATPCVEGCN